MKLFQKIREYVQLGDQLVFVLIDEVESLAHTRNVSMSGNEPSDAIRVVNALLTQIDIIKKLVINLPIINFPIRQHRN